ncbi:MAG: hypothetical protein H6718_14360 [Polyangiaceae bacterium]|nr:hypothetical protein [Myxococcales bacterium]MCB9586580.1 hypothetical protein [Polyangiaceae bacterium]
MIGALLAALVVAGQASAEPASSASRRVDVQVTGQSLPGLEASLRESLGRIALVLNLAPQAVAASDGSATAHVWVVVSPTGGAALVVRDQLSGQVLEQRQLEAESSELLVEQLTLLIRTALESRLEPVRPRGSVGDFSEVTAPSSPRTEAPEPQRAPDPGEASSKQAFGVMDTGRPLWDAPPPSPEPRSEQARGIRWGLEPGAALRWWSPDLPVRRAVSLGLSAELRDWAASPGIQLGFGYYENATSDTAVLSFDLETQEAWLLAKASLFESPAWELEVRSGPTLLWSLADVRTTASGYAAKEPRTHWDLVWRGELLAKYWFQEQFAFGLSLALDYDASPASYGINENGVERQVVREAELRPAVGLTLSTGFGASR